MDVDVMSPLAGGGVWTTPQKCCLPWLSTGLGGGWVRRSLAITRLGLLQWLSWRCCLQQGWPS